MRRAVAARRTAVALGLVLVAGACEGADYAPVSSVVEPRILAVAADPPVARPGDTVRLRPLLADAAGPLEGAELSWRACDPRAPIADPDLDCPPAGAVELPVEGGAAVLDLDAVLARWGEGLPEEPPPTDGCAGTAEVPIVLEVRTPSRRLLAVKRVGVAASVRGNPEVGAIVVDGDADPRQYRAGSEHRIAVALRRDSLDAACADDGVEVPEPVRVHLYASAGDLDDPFVDVEYAPDGAESADTTTWLAPGEGPVWLWAVAVEEDGGTGWRALRLEAP